MKKVIVTGGSRGIGAAIVRKFAENGDRVAFIYRNSDGAAKKLEEETGAFFIKADVSCPESAENAILQSIECLGGVDVLVNCAGISQIKLFTDITDGDWKKMLDTNLSGAFYAWYGNTIHYLVACLDCVVRALGAHELPGVIVVFGMFWILPF